MVKMKYNPPTKCPECGAPAFFVAEKNADRSPGYAYDNGPGTPTAILTGLIEKAHELGILNDSDYYSSRPPELKIIKALEIFASTVTEIDHVLEEDDDS